MTQINRRPFAIIVYGRTIPRILGRLLGWIFDIPNCGSAQAVSFFWFVFLAPELKGRGDILLHELVHIKQGWRLLRYGNLDQRLQIEVEAYREQLKWVEDPKSSAWQFAGSLAWGATIILSGRTTIMMAGGEESKAA